MKIDTPFVISMLQSIAIFALAITGILHTLDIDRTNEKLELLKLEVGQK